MAMDRTSRRRPARHGVVLVLEVLALGALSILLVLAMSGELIPSPRAETRAAPLPYIHPGRALAYLAWLVKEIVVANIDIARLVLNPQLPIDPVIGRFRTRLPGRLPRVVLGNSITLTPGTLTLYIRGNEILVHAITPGSATGPTIDEMERRLAGVFDTPPPSEPVKMTLTRTLPRGWGSRRK
jgi:multicomponent Na+:H+ antiporter subunit E